MARPATDLRQRILAAALEAFDQRGVDAASLRAIARAAGTTIGMIYYYFPTKDDLFDAVVDEAYTRFLADMRRVLTAPGPLRAKIRGLAAVLQGLSVEDRTVIRLVMRDVLTTTARRERLFARFRAGHIPLLVAAMAEARARGEVRDDAPLSLMLLATGTVGVLPQMVLGHLPLPDVPAGPARIDASLDVLFHGIGGPAGDADGGPPDADGDPPAE